MTTGRDIQLMLLARGFSVGKAGADGDIGPATLGAIEQALRRIPVTPMNLPEPVAKPAAGAVPADWMPWAKMQRIIVHWTAGTNRASALDQSHYHLLIEGDGLVVRGTHSIADNENTRDGKYAAHTLNCNAGSIGVSLCGMAGATESPFKAGKSPINEVQWQKLILVLADLCRRYAINPSPTTVLSHAEVQKNLGIAQRGKWDIARLPWDSSAKTAAAVGDRFRAEVKKHL